MAFYKINIYLDNSINFRKFVLSEDFNFEHMLAWKLWPSLP